MTKKDEMAEILGFVPGKEQRLQILQMARTEGVCIGEMCNRMALPSIYIVGDDGMIDTHLGRMTPEEFKKKVSKWYKLILITSR